MKRIQKWQRTLIKSIQLQLFITLISLPFLIGWGLPISLMSPISTLIFSPFLTIFLLLSSLTFFFELCYLPNTWIIWLLEQATSIWLWLLEFEQRTWLVALAKPPLAVLCAIPLSALAILHAKKLRSPLLSIACLASLLLGIGIIITFFYSNTCIIEKIPCNNKHVVIINHDKQTVVIDPAAMASRPSYESWISYTLVPAIIKKTGSMTIDHLIIYKISARTFDALRLLASKMNIRRIYIPKWQKKIPYFAWISYIKLKEYIEQQEGKIIRLHKNYTIFESKTAKLKIEKTESLNYYDASYEPLCVIGTIDNTQISEALTNTERVV